MWSTFKHLQEQNLRNPLSAHQHLPPQHDKKTKKTTEQAPLK